MKPEEDRSFTVYCDTEGKVTEILRDDGHFLSETIIGNFLFSIIAQSDLNKFLNFFVELKNDKSAIGWEINVNTETGAQTFSFFGAQYDEKIGIAAASSKSEANQLFAELTRINNEQANLLRLLSKEKAAFLSKTDEPPLAYYDELSRLNNELVNYQRELSKKNRELDELNKLKNQFLGMAAHDLRNPLMVIMNLSDFLLEDYNEQWNENQQKMLKTIEKSSHFMIRLLEDILDISAIESGNLNLYKEKTNLNTLIQKNLNLNSILADKKKISIQFQADKNNTVTNIDARKIEQVLNNLISNAVKFSLPGTKVTVRVTDHPNEVTVAVRDQGPGIPEDEQDKLFRPFSKISVKSTDGEKSTGLGLSIVRNIIQGHGGKVWVESKVGEGSTFCFSIPK